MGRPGRRRDDAQKLAEREVGGFHGALISRAGWRNATAEWSGRQETALSDDMADVQ